MNPMDDLASSLLLDLVTSLNQHPNVSKVHVNFGDPCNKNDISAWEQMYMCILPADLKQFYLLCNGLNLRWKYRSTSGDVVPLGNMVINSIKELRKIGGYLQNPSDIPTLMDIEMEADQVAHNTPSLNLKCKIFELDNSLKDGKVCLVFFTDSGKSQEWTHSAIWYLDRTLSWHLLARNFSAYFRLMLAHLGLPRWHLLLTPIGLPENVKHWYKQFAPLTQDVEDEHAKSAFTVHRLLSLSQNTVDFKKLFQEC